VLDFLAIDRFTGGGRDSAKFDAVVLWKPKFSVRLFLENPEPWELGWLALTLRDVQDGLTAVGFGAAKGFGQCTLEEGKLTLGILHDSDLPLPQAAKDEVDQRIITAVHAAGERLLGANGERSGVFQTVAYEASLQADWLTLANGWVRDFNWLVEHHRRPAEFVASTENLHDSYFTEQGGHWLPDLYPARVT
jgi:hypothetical protein